MLSHKAVVSVKRALVMTLLGGLFLLGAPNAAFADEGDGKGEGKGEKSGERGDRGGDRGDGDHGKRGDGDGDRRHRGDHGDRRDDGDRRRHDGDGDDDRHRRHYGGGDDDRHRRHYYYDDDRYYGDCHYRGRYRYCGYDGRCDYYGDRYHRGYDRDCGYYYGGDRYYGGGRYYGSGASTSFVAQMTPDQEVPYPGPDGARGTARIDVDDARHRLCYALSYEGIPRPTAGHIHRGAAGTSGPVAVNLDPSANGNQACVNGDPSVLQEIQSNPGGFYVNLHTVEYPDGAIRGQLY